MGGMCARVCPTEVLCEEACVRNTHEDKPVEIGLLQRYATDPDLRRRYSAVSNVASRAARRSPLSAEDPPDCPARIGLAMLGHDVVIFNKTDKLGGLNEYGIAAYKTVDDFAQKEVDWILEIGGIEVRNNTALGADVNLESSASPTTMPCS